MQAWEVGVSLVMTSNVESAAIAIGKHLLHLEGMTEKVKKQFKGLNEVIMGTLAIKIGEGMARGLGDVLLKAKELNAEITQLQKMNLDAASISRFQNMGVQATRDVRGVTEAQALRVANQIGSMVGPEHTTQNVLNQALNYGQVYGHTIKNFDRGMEGIQPMLRSLQQLGRLKDPETAIRSMDLLSKLSTITEGRISGDEILNAVKQGAPAMSGLSDRALIGSLIMSQPLGGHRAGTAWMSMWNQLIGGQTTQGVAKEMAKYGFLDPSYVNIQRQGRLRDQSGFTEFSIGGHISGVDRHGMHSRAQKGMAGGLNMRVPLEALDPAFRKATEAGPEEMFKHVKSRLEAQGVTGDAQVQALFRIFGRQTSQRLAHEWIRNLEQISGEIDRTMNALGLASAKKLQDAKDMSQALQNVGAAWENFLVQFGKANSDTVVKGLNALTDAFRGLTEVMRSMNPTVIQITTGALIGLFGLFTAGGVVTIMRAIGIGGWFTVGLRLLSMPLAAGGALFTALGPAGWMVVGLITLGATFAKFRTQIDGLMESVRKALGIDRLREFFGIDRPQWQDVPGWREPPGRVNPFLQGPGGNPYSFGSYGDGDWHGMIKQAVLGSNGGISTEGTLRVVARSLERMLEIAGHGASTGDNLIQSANLGGGDYGWGGGGGGGRSGGRGPHGGSAGMSNMRYGHHGHTPSLTEHIGSVGHFAHGNIIGREGGSRSWRNNNPGNMEFGPFARRHGAIGSDSRFAIFPSEEVGREAQRALLFESDRYKNLTLRQAIQKWAPATENNVPAYLRAMGGDPNTRMSEFSTEQRKQLMEAMRRHEGWRVGRQYPASQPANDNVSTEGLRMKPGATAGGPVHPAVIDLAKSIQATVPGFRRFGAMNDAYHQHLHRGSLHKSGLALDFTVSGNRAAARNQVQAMLERAGLTPRDYELINHPPGDPHSTAPHIHAGFRNRAAADRFRSSMVPPPNEAGKTIQVNSSLHMDGRKMAGGITRHQAEFANGPSHGGQGFDRTRTFAGNDSGFRTAV